MPFDWLIHPGVAWLPVIGVLGVACDYTFGDPQVLPHPVRVQGWVANGLESGLRRLNMSLGGNDVPLRILGGAGVLLLAVISGAVAFGLARLPGFGPLVALYLLYAGLALGSLLKEGMHVHKELYVRDDLLGARAALGLLVSRETASLDYQGVARGLSETVSENSNDGFVAPFFYFTLGGVLGGAPEWGVAALWAYKAVSTLDSMWGYTSEPWRVFGWAAARTDDVLAWLPARLSAVSILVAAIAHRSLASADFTALLRRVAADASKTASPNAGWPMSAAAWCCGAWLGGPATYFGQRMDKPLLGPSAGEWNAARSLGLFLLVRNACLGSAGTLLALGTMLLAFF